MKNFKPIQLSNKEVAVFGISGAGCSNLINNHKKQGKQVYDHLANYPEVESIYNQNQKDKGRNEHTFFSMMVMGDDYEELNHASKALMVNTTQVNIRRYHLGAPLIPIEMVVESEAPAFQADFHGTMQKKFPRWSDAEIRMMYKLMVECPDPEINHIVRQTLSFKTMKSDGSFIDQPCPWDINEQAMTDWHHRARGDVTMNGPPLPTPNEIMQDRKLLADLMSRTLSLVGQSKPPYQERKSLPAWLTQLITFNHTCKADADTPENSDDSLRNQS
jgi:hypothetical protein